MKKKLYWLLSVLILLSMLLGACGTEAEVTEAPAEPEVVETEEAPEPVVEATEEPTPEPEPVMVDLNEPFGAMLANMAGYNTVRADGLMTELVEESQYLDLEVSPKGAFYCFPACRCDEPSLKVAEELLRQAHVATVPGAAFGDCGEHHLRLSYAASKDQIAEALKRTEIYFEQGSM